MKILTLSFLLFPLLIMAQPGRTTAINNLLDNWHQAAGRADADVFFGSMADDAIYIGTDKTERWDKESFMAFARPYFDRGKAWDFKPYDRQVIFSRDGKTAWFSELLDTWMGVCRGSGVVTKEKGGWKIRQYHLSVTVPNDIIKNFIELVNTYESVQEIDN